MKKSVKYILTALVVFVAATCLWLADRYLIRHVEAVNAAATAVTDAEQPTSGTADIHSVQPVIADPLYSYEDESAIVRIQRFEQQIDGDENVYFAAEVIVSDPGRLASAFAGDTFGRNILEKTSSIAERHEAIFAVNGDYFGFRNDGIQIRNGQLYRDRPERMGAAINAQGELIIYDETSTTGEELLKEGILQTMSFGPALIIDGVTQHYEGKVLVDKNLGNRAIEGTHPRTGIGMIAPCHYLFIVADGRKEGYSIGPDINEFAKLFESFGCTQAYNLDGGGSSTMYFQGEVINNPLGKGVSHEREISDIFYIVGNKE